MLRVYVFHVLGVTHYGTTIILVKLWQKGSCVHPNEFGQIMAKRISMFITINLVK